MNNRNTELEPSASRKRSRDKESENDVDSSSLSLEENLTFSDTLMALRMMHAQFPDIGKVSLQPFILRSQLYSSIKDRTQVDRELESLRRDNMLRIFKLNTGQDDHAIMFMDDYINQFYKMLRRMGENIMVINSSTCRRLVVQSDSIDRIVGKTAEKRQNEVTIFDWFKTHVMQSKLDTGISHQELCALLSLGGKVKDEHISRLISAGLLIRQLIDPNMYWFSIPNIGSVLKGLSQGRKELLSYLNRRKYKEMMLVSLEKKRLRLSPLDMRFHLRDLIGSGHLKTIQTPGGLIVRVAKD